MADQETVRRIARGLPGVSEGADWFGFSVDVKGKAKGFAWTWRERVDPKKARVANPGVLAVRVANQDDKAALLDADPAKFFTEPHYNGYPAVLVRLPALSEAELAQVLVEAWRCVAPKPLLAAYDAGVASDELSGSRTTKAVGKPAKQAVAKTPAVANKPARKPAKQVSAKKPAKQAVANKPAKKPAKPVSANKPAKKPAKQADAKKAPAKKPAANTR